MSIAVILVALLLVFLAFRFIAGVVEFGVILLIIGAAFYFLSQGGM